MSLKKIRVIAATAAILAFISMYIVISGFDGKRSGNIISQNQKAVTVVGAKQDIAPYTKITAEMVSLQNIAVGGEIQNYFTATEDVVGKISKSDIYAGELISTARVAEETDTSLGLAMRLEEGKRGVTVAVDVEKGISATIKAGNYVDVIYVGKVDSEGVGGAYTASAYFDSVSGVKKPVNSQTLYHGLGQYFAVTAMQNIKVVSLDNIFYKDDSKTSYQSVTLEVTPGQAAQIALMSGGEGAIRLSLRPQEDKTLISEPRNEVFKDK